MGSECKKSIIRVQWAWSTVLINPYNRPLHADARCEPTGAAPVSPEFFAVESGALSLAAAEVLANDQAAVLSTAEGEVLAGGLTAAGGVRVAGMTVVAA